MYLLDVFTHTQTSKTPQGQEDIHTDIAGMRRDVGETLTLLGKHLEAR